MFCLGRKWKKFNLPQVAQAAEPAVSPTAGRPGMSYQPTPAMYPASRASRSIRPLGIHPFVNPFLFALVPVDSRFERRPFLLRLLHESLLNLEIFLSPIFLSWRK